VLFVNDGLMFIYRWSLVFYFSKWKNKPQKKK